MASTTEAIESIDSLSDALWRDGRVFTERERELLTDILKRAGNAGSPEAGEKAAIAARIATAVGGAIAQRILRSAEAETTLQATEPTPHPIGGASGSITLGPAPKYVGPGPKGSQELVMRGPGPKGDSARKYGPGPKAAGPGPKMGGPGPKMGGPGPKCGPGPKGGPGPKMRGPGPKGYRVLDRGPGPHPRAVGKHAHAHRAEAQSARSGAPVLVLDEFLAPQELERLTKYVEAHESDFVLSEVVAPGATGTAVDFEHRKSRVLFELGEHEAVISGRILSYLPRILSAVGMEPFPIAQVEAQITASNDGDFFRPHEDNGEPPLQTRQLTFVYFFNREPRPFRGGELRIYDPRHAGNGGSRGSAYRAIVPKQNQMVCFPSHLLHEISPVECPSGAFRDSRFTLNGWFHRPE
jgi:2-oxoglutarate-Fe(II)-dependent oxygenase superfamily protein